MPVYEYRCNSCRRKVNLLQHSLPPDAPTCPYCGSELERILSTFATHKSYRDAYDDVLSHRSLTERMERGEWPAEQIEQKRREATGLPYPPQEEAA